jgi:hypothetical protein
MSDSNNEALAVAEERKRKRLDAWRLRQQQQQEPPKKVSLSLGAVKRIPKKQYVGPLVKRPPPSSFFVEEDSDEELDMDSGPRKRPMDLMDDFTDAPPAPSKRTKISGRRWDSAPAVSTTEAIENTRPTAAPMKDALDHFMEKLEAGASGTVTASDDGESISINVGGSMMRGLASNSTQPSPLGGNAITAEDLAKFHHQSGGSNKKSNRTIESAADDEMPVYQPSDWLSDAASDTDDENEEQARRALIEALKSAPAPENNVVVAQPDETVSLDRPAQTVAEFKSEKSRREDRLRQLEQEAIRARNLAQDAPDLGRLYADESGIMEEAERDLQAAQAAPDALTVLAELNKKKELKAVDHSKVDYMPFQKNLYRVPRSLANLTNDQIVDMRAKLKVRVRGHGAPAPVSAFEECGLSEKILDMLQFQKITDPFPIQAQCIPCIMGKCVVPCDCPIVKCCHA